jgi:hypothetical protein
MHTRVHENMCAHALIHFYLSLSPVVTAETIGPATHSAHDLNREP